MKIKTKPVNLKWAACLMLCLPYAATQAVVQYSVTDLGSLGGNYNLGLSVNNSGQVTGFSHILDNTSEHAFFGDGVTTPFDLGTLGGTFSQGYGVDSLGRVVGSATLLGDILYHGFIWQGGATPPSVPLTDLKPLVDPGFSRAFSINDNGQATGFSSTADGAEHAVIWQANGAVTDLSTLDGTGSSQGLAIDLAGQVAGYSSVTGNAATHAVLWSNGTMKDLGTLGGSYSAAFGMNNSGAITGSAATTNDAAQHAFLWQPNQIPQMRDLGMLPLTSVDASNMSVGYGVDGVGDVVGFSTRSNNAARSAFIWQSSTGLVNLNTLIDPALGWDLLEARAISEDGTYITGIGKFEGQVHAFLLKNEVVDTTPPTVSFVITPALPNGLAGWYSSPPNINWTVNEPESTISSENGCVDVPAVADTTGLILTCTATSPGGTTGPISTPNLKVDTVPPTILGIPAPITQVADNQAVAVVNYIPPPTATDLISGVAGGVSCVPASGSTFVLGLTQVTCSASDNAGNRSSASFDVTVVDQTAPVIAVTPNITQVADDINGAVVAYVTPAATDNVAVSAAGVSCAPASGTVFPIGLTPVTCTASDNAGNTVNSVSFNVIIADLLSTSDLTPPVFANVPVDSIHAAANSAGAAVSYLQPSVTDAESGITAAGVSCIPASGAIFPLGANTVNCTASNNAGNVNTVSFVITVVDQTPPTFTACPGTVSLTEGQPLNQPNVTDNVSTIVNVSGAPVAPLPLGLTTVTWTATDDAGLSSTCVQQVTVSAILPVTETIGVTTASCTRRSNSTGNWSVQGSSTVTTNNTIQLFKTATAPVDSTSGTLGAATVQSNRSWRFQVRSGPACTSLISLRSTAGTVRERIGINVK